MTDTLKKLQRARAALVINHPFFGSLALRLVFEPCHAIATADVDGTTMRYNPPWIDSLTLPETIGVLAHEVGHCAFGHIWRMGGRDPEQWNIAADISENGILVKAGLTLPKGALLDHSLPVGASADEIYAKRSRRPRGGGQGKPANGQGQAQGAGAGAQGAPGSGKPTPGQGSAPTGAGSDPGGCGGMRQPTGANGKPATPAEITQQQGEWQVATVQAAKVAKAAGNLPGEIARLVDQVVKPRIDWKEVLRRFISSTVPGDFSMIPPNRRYIPMGLYLPSLKPNRIGTLAIMVDTSGSIGRDELNAFAAEINAIAEESRPDLVKVIYCDARVNGTADFEPGEVITLKAMGGGGTDFRPPFKYLEDLGEDPHCAVYLTDLQCNSFPPEPSYPVLWVSTDRETAPFGEIVKLDLHA